jgi:phosphatidylinositol phospholipase C, delta
MLYQKFHTQIVDFHRKFITRIYPAGSRVDSSNYDPISSFNAGA